MSLILTNFYDKLRNTVNVSEIVRNIVSLQKKGGEFIGICPFHSEKSPSFTVNDKKRFYHCFGCGAHGDVIKFESEHSGLSYKDAAYKIADKFGIERPKFTKEQEKEQQLSDRILSVLNLASNFFAANINSKITDILNKRGVSSEIVANYKIGYTGGRGELLEYFNKKNVRPDDLEASGLLAKNQDGRYYEVFRDRIIIPIFSNFGKVIAFGGRSLGDEMPKYLNSPETLVFKKGECFYGEEIATGAAYKSGKVIIVEGYFDVISMHLAGFLETVASLGTAVTPYHLQKLWKIAGEIIICLDGDEAGLRASKKVLATAIPLISAHHKLSFAILPKGLDPDEVVKKYGSSAISKIIDNRMSFSEYIFYSHTTGKQFNIPEEKSELERELAEIASQIKDEYLKKNIASYFKNQCWALFNNKIQHPKTAIISLSSQTNKFTELENIENTIVIFLVNFFSSFTKTKVESALVGILEKNNNLQGLIECILDIICSEDAIEGRELISLLKKTSFYKQFEILSNRYKNSLPNTSSSINSSEILDFLLAKRHLIYLTNEFSAIMQIMDETTEEKAKFYLSEIKATKDKIDRFNTQVTLNNR